MFKMIVQDGGAFNTIRHMSNVFWSIYCQFLSWL